MRYRNQTMVFAVIGLLLGVGWVSAQDWPQWRGPNRDAIADNFSTPQSWPESLTKKWSVEVGNGVSTPSVHGGKLFVMALQDGDEVMRCLDADTGEELWQDRYPARGASGPARSFPGTRASPVISDGYVATMGVDGTISCWDATRGALKWRNNEYEGEVPRFWTSSSPIIFEGMCIVQFGSDGDGGIAAFDLDSGEQKWSWTGDGSAYGSPVFITIDDTQAVVAPTAQQLVLLDAASGKQLWSMEYRQGRYNAATPVVSGNTLMFAGPERGITAVTFTKDGENFVSAEQWRNTDTTTTCLFNSPVLIDGFLYGLSTANMLFCVNADDGATAWSNSVSGNPADGQAAPAQAQSGQTGESARSGQRQGRGSGRGGGQRGGRRGGGRGGYGSIVSAGSALVALTPAGELIVYKPDNASFVELARYKVAESQTYAYPVLLGTNIYIKDANNVTMWSLD